VGSLDAEVTRDTVLAVGNRLRGIPRWSGNLWTAYHVCRGPVAGLILGGGVTYVGRRAGNLQDSYFISGYTRLNLTAGHKIADRYRPAVIVRNITNRIYIEQPLALTTNYPGAPRTVSATLAIEL